MAAVSSDELTPELMVSVLAKYATQARLDKQAFDLAGIQQGAQHALQTAGQYAQTAWNTPGVSQSLIGAGLGAGAGLLGSTGTKRKNWVANALTGAALGGLGGYGVYAAGKAMEPNSDERAAQAKAQAQAAAAEAKQKALAGMSPPGRLATQAVDAIKPGLESVSQLGGHPPNAALGGATLAGGAVGAAAGYESGRNNLLTTNRGAINAAIQQQTANKTLSPAGARLGQAQGNLEEFQTDPGARGSYARKVTEMLMRRQVDTRKINMLPRGLMRAKPMIRGTATGLGAAALTNAIGQRLLSPATNNPPAQP